MAKRAGAKREGPRLRWKPTAAILGLVLLAALDVVLVILALDHVRPSSSDGRGRTRSTSEAPAAAPSATGSDAATRASSKSTTDPVPEGPLLLALAPDGTLLRATLGGCTDESSPQVAVSTDDGKTFVHRRVSAELNGVMGVRADGADDVRVVGADGDCTARSYEAAAASQRWQAGSSEETWYLTLGGDMVHAPGGVVETPCTPQILSTVGAVRLLCSDGAVLGTADDGESWTTLGRLPDASALAFDGPSRGYALQTRKNCPAAAMTTDDGGASWEFADCLDGEASRAIAARGDVAVALVDDHVFRSEDGAATWTQVG